MRFTLFITFVFLFNLVRGQIDTDRPAFTNSVNVVPSKTLQFEGGLHYFYADNGAAPTFATEDFEGCLLEFQQYSLPIGVLRYGIAERTELRLSLPSISLVSGTLLKDSADYSSSGTDGLFGLGIKQRLYQGEKFSLSGLFSLSTYKINDQLTEQNRWLFASTDILWRYSITDKIIAAGTVGFSPDIYGNRFNAAALIGAYITPTFWVQGEYVSESILYYEAGFWSEIITVNLSAQKTLNDKNAIDFTVGSALFGSMLPPNLAVQVGYAHSFDLKK